MFGPSPPKSSFSVTFILVSGLSSSTVNVSAEAVGKSFTEFTNIETSAVALSPLASVIVYLKISRPLKLAKGVYNNLSSVGLLGVPLSSTDTVPLFSDLSETKVIFPLFGPSPPKSSLFKTLIKLSTHQKPIIMELILLNTQL